MGEVYSYAAQITIWLGPDDENFKTASAVLRRICEMQKKVNPTFDHDNYWPLPDEPDEICHEESRAVPLFFARSYFSRIWVIQEVAAANAWHWEIFGQGFAVLLKKYLASIHCYSLWSWF
jgi:hypothetical protein